MIVELQITAESFYGHGFEVNDTNVWLGCESGLTHFLRKVEDFFRACALTLSL